MGITFAVLKTSGTTPSSRDLLIRRLMGLLKGDLIFLMRYELMLSGPVLCLALRELMVKNISDEMIPRLKKKE